MSKAKDGVRGCLRTLTHENVVCMCACATRHNLLRFCYKSALKFAAELLAQITVHGDNFKLLSYSLHLICQRLAVGRSAAHGAVHMEVVLCQVCKMRTSMCVHSL